jgi:hypothetical protein
MLCASPLTTSRHGTQILGHLGKRAQFLAALMQRGIIELLGIVSKRQYLAMNVLFKVIGTLYGTEMLCSHSCN